MKEKNRKTIFFDFGGVIADTLPGVAKIHNEIMRQFGKEATATPELIRGNWNGWEHLYTRVYGFSKEELLQVVPLYKELIAQEGPTEIFDGMGEVIKKLSGTNPLIVASSNYSPRILATLEAGQVERCFREIYGRDELRGLEKHDPRFFQIPIDNLLLEKEHILTIGDTAGEVAGARRAGVPIVACSWGWQDRDTLVAARPDYLADSPKELFSILQKI